MSYVLSHLQFLDLNLQMRVYNMKKPQMRVYNMEKPQKSESMKGWGGVENLRGQQDTKWKTETGTREGGGRLEQKGERRRDNEH